MFPKAFDCFLIEQRLQGGGSAAGIFAFLPTGMVTDFPFIIHSDFVLASSREAILMDNKWNLGSLEHVPLAYVRALMTCLNSVETIGLGTKSDVLDFLPVKESPFPELNSVRDTIKLMLQSECIVPCQSFLDEQIVLCRPSNALLIYPEFHSILAKAKLHGITLGAVSSKMKHAVDESVDHEEYDEIWEFLDVGFADSDYDWYLNFIKTSNLISRSSEDLYIDIICFLADHWDSFPRHSVNSIPLVQYVTWSGDTMLCSVLQIRQDTLKVRIVWEANEHALLSNWNREVGCPNDVFFCPVYLVNSLVKAGDQVRRKDWFTRTAGVVITDTFQYCMDLISSIRKNKDPGIVVQLTHFVYYSAKKKNHIKHLDMQRLLRSLPVVEKSGKVSLCSRSLVPASSGTWTKLFGSINPLSVESDDESSIDQHNLCHHNDMDDSKQNCGYYAELGDVYSAADKCNGETIAENELLNFLVKNEKAFDLPKAPPPDIPLKLSSTDLTCDQALLLLEWIKYLRWNKQLEPLARFYESIRCTNWLKTYAGFKSPKHCHLLDSMENNAILELGRKLCVFSAVDEVYYPLNIRSYISELEFIGVQVKEWTMSELITPRVKQLASYKIVDPALVILLLEFIKYLRGSNKLSEDLIKKLKEGKWLKTLNGYSCPSGSIFVMSLEKAIKQITNLHIVDSLYYKNKLSPFVYELKFLGVVVDVEEVYKLIPKSFRFPEYLSSLTVESVFLFLKCMRSVGPAEFCANHDIRCKAWVRTGSGFKCPSETILSDSNLIDLAGVVSYSFIDESHYGTDIRSYKAELKEIGAIVGLDSAGESVVNRLKSFISSTGLSAFNVISLLRLFKSARSSVPSFVDSVVNYLSGEKWVKTKHGNQYATNSILFDSEWASISQLIDLPFIDDTSYGVQISSFKEELKILGVVVNLRDGIHNIVHGLKVEEDPSLVTADAAFVILQCAESLLNSNLPSDKILLEELLQKLRVAKWVKTHMGYRLPGEALLFNREWECLLKEFDGPFIDRHFYKKFTSAQDNVLREIGVKTDLEDACSLIVKNLTSHVQTNQVYRIYKFLQKFHWTPKSEDRSEHKLWIPDESDSLRGKWVNNVDCVIYDENNLFGHCLNSLNNYYDKGLLPFLQSAFDVSEVPSLDHHVALWKLWCETADKVSGEKVKLFWGLLSRNCVEDVLRNRENFQSTFTKLPTLTVGTQLGTDIQLLEKEEVYIGDELLLKKAFSESSNCPLFAWFPEDFSISSVTLGEIYRSLGVKKISESVEYSVNGAFIKMEKEEVGLIGKPLLKLVMAFLASPQMSVPARKRHSMATTLFDIPVFWTDAELQVKYRLQLPLSRKFLHADINKMVFFDSNVPRFLVHKPSWSKGQKDVQLANDFARAISEAVLSDSRDLKNLIKMGFPYLLTEDDIDVLLMLENLEVSAADQEFLDELYSPVVIPSKRRLHFDDNAVAPCTPSPNLKSPKRKHDNY